MAPNNECKDVYRPRDQLCLVHPTVINGARPHPRFRPSLGSRRKIFAFSIPSTERGFNGKGEAGGVLPYPAPMENSGTLTRQHRHPSPHAGNHPCRWNI